MDTTNLDHRELGGNGLVGLVRVVLSPIKKRPGPRHVTPDSTEATI